MTIETANVELDPSQLEAHTLTQLSTSRTFRPSTRGVKGCGLGGDAHATCCATAPLAGPGVNSQPFSRRMGARSECRCAPRLYLGAMTGARSPRHLRHRQ